MKPKPMLPLLLPACGMLVITLCFPGETARGVRDALTLCGTAVIPSLFPFFALCAFLSRSGLIALLGSRAEKVMRVLFRLPGAAAGAVVLALCGGYPIGMRMTAQLYAQGRLSAEEAERMSLFCVCAGPAFVVGTVGASMLGSRACGRILFAALTFSALTVGVLLRFTASAQPAPVVKRVQLESVSRSVCAAVADAGEAMLSVCAWVLLFSGICAAANRLPQSIAVPIGCLLEVTNGCRTASAARLPLELIAAILGFGGFAVQCQVLPDVNACGVRLSRFWAFRAVAAALSACCCSVLLRMFPQTKAVLLLQNGAMVQPLSASAPASAALLAVAAVFIWNTGEQKTKILKKS